MIIFNPTEGHNLDKVVISNGEYTLYDVFDKFYPHVKIISSNLLDTKYNIPYALWFEPHLIYPTIHSSNISIPKNYSKHFLYQNRIPKLERTYLYNKMIENNLLDYCMYSWNVENIKKYPGRNPNHKNMLLETSIANYNKIDNHTEFIDMSSLNSFYKNTFCSILVESEIDEDIIFFTEKTTKAIANKHPFIFFNSPYSIKKLKEFGFKTFDKWWDESYDTISDINERIGKIIELITQLSKKNNNELIQIRKEMDAILTHNRNNLFFLKDNYPNYFKYSYLLA